MASPPRDDYSSIKKNFLAPFFDVHGLRRRLSRTNDHPNLRTKAIVLPNQGSLKYGPTGNLRRVKRVRRDAQSVPHFSWCDRRCRAYSLGDASRRRQRRIKRQSGAFGHLQAAQSVRRSIRARARRLRGETGLYGFVSADRKSATARRVAEVAPARPAEQSLTVAVRDLRLSFGSLIVLQGIDLSVSTGVLHALIGPNGAGKSTLVNVITGLLPPTAGQTLVNGKPITANPPDLIARQRVLRTFQASN